jgi:hypothetical protein
VQLFSSGKCRLPIFFSSYGIVAQEGHNANASTQDGVVFTGWARLVKAILSTAPLARKRVRENVSVNEKGRVVAPDLLD